MRILVFDVDKQRIIKRRGCDFDSIVAGSSGYLKAKFNFLGTDWNGCKKAASFWLDNNEYPMLLDADNSCVIPEEALTGSVFQVSVMGIRPNTTYKILTNKTKVKQEV